MLNRTLLSLVVAAVGGLAFLSIKDYNDYQDEQSVIAQTEAAEDASVLSAQDNQINALSREVERLRTECDKGYYAYEQLVETGRDDVFAPECVPLTDEERAARQQEIIIESVDEQPVIEQSEPEAVEE